MKVMSTSIGDGINWLKKEERKVIREMNFNNSETSTLIGNERLHYIRSIISMLDSYDKTINVNSIYIIGTDNE